MYELAWRMSRDNNDLLWWSIIGHTEQLLMLKSEVDKYLIGSGNLRDHVSRLNVNPSVSSDGSGSSENSRSVGKCHIVAGPYKGLKSLKRFTNLPLGSMSPILN